MRCKQRRFRFLFGVLVGNILLLSGGCSLPFITPVALGKFEIHSGDRTENRTDTIYQAEVGQAASTVSPSVSKSIPRSWWTYLIAGGLSSFAVMLLVVGYFRYRGTLKRLVRSMEGEIKGTPLGEKLSSRLDSSQKQLIKAFR